MKLSEKIKYLRKKQGYTQEQLAKKCNVSRQVITKLEADMSIPETDKFILLRKLFKFSIDELLKDELDVFEKDKNPSCGKTTFNDTESVIYEGILVKESITYENIIDLMEIKKSGIELFYHVSILFSFYSLPFSVTKTTVILYS